MNSNLQNNFENAQTHPIEWWLSWPAIVIAFIVFWPIGLFLTWKRFTVDKKLNLLPGKIFFILGYACLFLVLLQLRANIFRNEKNHYIPEMIFLLLLGLCLIAVGKKIKDNDTKSKKYISIIANEGIIDIDNIAAAIPTSYDNARKDLQKMIDKGFFDGAYINESERQITLPKRHQEHSSNQSNITPESTKMHAVTCKCCGAQNSVADGTVGDCEFCGSKIEI